MTWAYAVIIVITRTVVQQLLCLLIAPHITCVSAVAAVCLRSCGKWKPIFPGVYSCLLSSGSQYHFHSDIPCMAPQQRRSLV